MYFQCSNLLQVATFWLIARCIDIHLTRSIPVVLSGFEYSHASNDSHNKCIEVYSNVQEHSLDGNIMIRRHQRSELVNYQLWNWRWAAWHCVLGVLSDIFVYCNSYEWPFPQIHSTMASKKAGKVQIMLGGNVSVISHHNMYHQLPWISALYWIHMIVNISRASLIEWMYIMQTADEHIL